LCDEVVSRVSGRNRRSLGDEHALASRRVGLADSQNRLQVSVRVHDVAILTIDEINCVTIRIGGFRHACSVRSNRHQLVAVTRHSMNINTGSLRSVIKSSSDQQRSFNKKNKKEYKTKEHSPGLGGNHLRVVVVIRSVHEPRGSVNLKYRKLKKRNRNWNIFFYVSMSACQHVSKNEKK
jgi:hypothetical protein